MNSVIVGPLERCLPLNRCGSTLVAERSEMHLLPGAGAPTVFLPVNAEPAFLSRSYTYKQWCGSGFGQKTGVWALYLKQIEFLKVQKNQYFR